MRIWSLNFLTKNKFSMLAVLSILIVGMTLFSPLTAEAKEPLSNEQREEIEGVIYDYLMANPEVLIKAIDTMRENKQAVEQNQIKENLRLANTALYKDPTSPIHGNKDASVTIVEFFDYRCGYCKRVFPALQELLDTDDDINVVFKEFPILGEDSVFASRAAQATWFNWPEKYLKFHSELISARGALSATKVLELAATVGIDTNVLKEAMDGEDVSEAIARNMELAEFLKINGTPAFIIGNELIPGAIDIDTMKSLINEARNNS